VFESAVYTAADVDLPPGTTCLFHTAGLVERANPADELLGEDRVIDALRRWPGLASAAETLATLVADADRFAQGVEPADDVALLVVRSS
jgi:serine phosphatase RsbU (regulator of sigma subunit)